MAALPYKAISASVLMVAAYVFKLKEIVCFSIVRFRGD